MVRDSFAVPYKQLTPGLQAVPTVAAQIPLGGGGSVTQWVEIEQIVVYDSSATPTTLTLTDGASKTLVFSLPQYVTVISFPRPVKFLGACTWVASTATLTAEVKGYYL